MTPTEPYFRLSLPPAEMLWKFEPLLFSAARYTCNEHTMLVWEVLPKCWGLRKRGAWFIVFVRRAFIRGRVRKRPWLYSCSSQRVCNCFWLHLENLMSQGKTFVWVTEQKWSSYSESELSQHHCENTKVRAMGYEQNALDIRAPEMCSHTELLSYALMHDKKMPEPAVKLWLFELLKAARTQLAFTINSNRSSFLFPFCKG